MVGIVDPVKVETCPTDTARPLPIKTGRRVTVRTPFWHRREVYRSPALTSLFEMISSAARSSGFFVPTL
jgi:hypothetical protein